MSLTSNVPALQITSTGVVSPDTSTVLSGVLADYNAAFGGNLNITNVGTPQGYLAAQQTSYIQDANAALTYLMNMVNPNTNEGRWQDAIGNVYFITRKPATATVVTAQCIGLNGTLIPAGSLVSDGTYTYASLGAVTIPPSGTIDNTFANQTLGAIACPSNSLNKITTVLAGWDAITNAAAGVIGNDVESTYDFEIRRYASVAQNARDSLDSIRGAVMSVAGVTDVYAIENSTGSTVTKGSTSYSVIAHSIYIAVVGGTDADVAQAIWSKKAPGCDYNGSTSVTVYDTTGFTTPYPSYTVKFQRPSAVPIKFAVSIVNSPSLPSNIVDLTKTAIINAFYGVDSNNKANIGGTTYAGSFYDAVTDIGSNIYVTSILVGTSTPTLPSVTIGIDQYPTIDASNIAVTLV